MTPFLFALIAAPALAPAAAAAQAPPSGGMTMTGVLIQFGAIFALFYFLFIRPQQKQRRAHEERIRQVKKGDEIVTAGGVIGEVQHIREGMKDGAPVVTLDDRITIKSAETRMIIERRAIARVVARETAVAEIPK
jgi:preprotein translocase subunit YajC